MVHIAGAGPVVRFIRGHKWSQFSSACTFLAVVRHHMLLEELHKSVSEWKKSRIVNQKTGKHSLVPGTSCDMFKVKLNLLSIEQRMKVKFALVASPISRVFAY